MKRVLWDEDDDYRKYFNRMTLINEELDQDWEYEVDNYEVPEHKKDPRQLEFDFEGEY